MATFAFIHGAGDVGWYWHLVQAELQRRGHDSVAPDLPVEDDTAGLAEYANAVVDAIEDRRDVIVVAQSFGGYVAPLVAERVDARLIVLVAAMIPSPGESAEEMFANTHWAPEPLEDSSERAVFYHDVPWALADEALSRGRRQSDKPGREPWPLRAWPDIETHFVLCRNDRFFPERWLRPLVRDRLGIEPDEIDSGHCPALSHPTELAGLLDRYASEGHSVPMESVFEAAGGEVGLQRLAGAWHARVLVDEVVGHAFRHGFQPDHTQRLAAYWAEALGGPAAYTSIYGDASSVVRIHSGNGEHDDMDRRAIACFDLALEDAGLVSDDALRATLHEYFAWATTTTMAAYPRSPDDVPTGLRIPRWSWDGPQPDG